MDGRNIIMVKEVATQGSSESIERRYEDDPSPTEDSLDATAKRGRDDHKKKSVRFLIVDPNETQHRSGSIHEELCQLDRMKSRSTSKVQARSVSLADRPPPVFSITGIHGAEGPLLFSGAANAQATTSSQREIDEKIDRLLEESTSHDDAALHPKDSEDRLRDRRMTVFQHQLLEFRHSETAKTELKLRLQRLSTFLCVASVLAVVLAVADLECSYAFGTNAPRLTTANASNISLVSATPTAEICLKTGTSVVSVLTCALLYSYFHQHCRLLIVKHQLPRGATVVASPDRWQFVVELILCIFHVPPFAGGRSFPGELQLVSFLRLYMVGRYMREHNHLAFSKSTRFLASVLQTELGAGFLVKTFFIKWPFCMVGVCYCLNLFGVGYLVFSIDRFFCPLNHNPLLDVIWMQVVTMTTLGFGDVVPESVMARAFVGMSSVFGIFLMALLISVIHETLQMSQQEKRILAYVERQEFADRLKHCAARCIQATWRLYRFKLSHRPNSPPRRIPRILRLVRPGRTKKGLIKDLYDTLTRWREIRKSKAQDDSWAKDFVADNTAIMLTDVARRLEKMDAILKRSLGIEDDDEEGQGGQEEVLVDIKYHPAMRSNDLGQPSAQIDRSFPSSGLHGDRKMAADDGISMETVLYHLGDLGASLEESHHRTMTEFQALQSLIMARREGVVGLPGDTAANTRNSPIQ